MKLPWINREYSWLKFNFRVLSEASDSFNPLLERLKFLGIVASNLEEFFMIRVAVIKRQLDQEQMNDPLQEKPQTILKTIISEVNRMHKEQYKIFSQLCKELQTQGIFIHTEEKDMLPYKEILEEHFDKEIYPLLTPLSVSQTHPFPTLHSGKLYMLMELSALPSHSLTEKPSLSFIELPLSAVKRFYQVQPSVFVPIELIIRLFLPKIYSSYNIEYWGIIRITRDADYEHQTDGAYDMISSIEKNIKRFHKREAVKLEVSKDISQKTLKILCEHHHLSNDMVFVIPSLLNLKDLFSLYESCEKNDLKLHPFEPLLPSVFSKAKSVALFSLIAKEDILLLHPYQSYEPVLWLLEAAANDPNVIAIKQTLYRTSSKSQIIHWLTRAAENGKYVSVIDELTARFDEKRNILWAKHLQDAGAHVSYGIAHLKTHAKALLIVRKERSGIRRYVHLATGNYNETTATMYSDFSFFSANNDLCEDVNQLFNLLTGFSLPQSWKKLSVAPLGLRKRLLYLIHREMRNAQAGLKAEIRAKMNSLSDEEVIRALYEASRAGVQIRLIIRGICSLVPGVKGFSENISVKSVVGRYLEHSRFYYFYNNGEEEYYLSSADCMMRNLDRRIEILFPIQSKNLEKTLDTVFRIQWEDTANSWTLQSDGSYQSAGKRQADSQDSFYNTYRFFSQEEREPKK